MCIYMYGHHAMCFMEIFSRAREWCDGLNMHKLTKYTEMQSIQNFLSIIHANNLHYFCMWTCVAEWLLVVVDVVACCWCNPLQLHRCWFWAFATCSGGVFPSINWQKHSTCTHGGDHHCNLRCCMVFFSAWHPILATWWDTHSLIWEDALYWENRQPLAKHLLAI